jgi:nicotinamidase-related amidase
MTKVKCLTGAGSALLAIALAASPLMHIARAQTIIEDWSNVKAPSPPELKPVTLDPKTTALLLLDFGKQNCGARPRCVASLPQVEKLAAAARAKNVLVVHSLFGQLTAADLFKEVAPQGDEQLVKSGANKFLRTDLEKILKDKGITTVIVTGTAAHGAVLNTAAAAALMGLKVVLPVDGVSAENTYAEQYTAWHLANAPGGIAPQVTITKIDMIQFGTAS